MTDPSSQYLLRDVVPLEVTSDVTGRTISVNPDMMRFALLPGWHPEALEAVRTDYEQLNVGGYKPVRLGRILAQPVLEAESPDELATALVPIIGKLRWYAWTMSSALQQLEPACPHLAYEDKRQKTNVSRNGMILTLLWKHGLLLAPMSEWAYAHHFVSRVMPDISTLSFGPCEALVHGVEDTPDGKSWENRGRRRHMMARLLMAMQGVREAGDLDQTVLRSFQPVLDLSQRGSSAGEVDLFTSFRPGTLFDAIQRVFQRAYADRPDVLAKLSRSRHLRQLLPGRGTRVRELADPGFAWVAKRYPAHGDWGAAAARHIASMENRVDLTSDIRNLDVWLQSWLPAEDCPTTPLAFCRRDFDGTARVRTALRAREAKPARIAYLLLTATRFFDSVLDAVRRVDGGIDSAYRNPVEDVTPPRRGAGSGKGQTHRVAMPPWLIREVRELLATEDWAREQDDDYFLHVDPKSGLTERVWSPVRLELFRLRTLLPVRTKQVQLLDSGEGDALVWQADPNTPLMGQWVKNESHWAPANGEERKLGLLRPIYDADLGGYLTGLFISTNKTADRTENFSDIGYEIPYEHPEVIALVLRLRAWQARYNPTAGPRKRTELVTMTLGNVASADVEAVLPGLHYLFRDPAMPGYAHEPVTQGRISRYWLKILDECERRINARARAGDPLARPVEIINKRFLSGYPKSSIFDLHSLRVSGLTELAMAGCPLHVLMMLAGHATWVMTLYYVKPSAAHISRELNAARARAEEILGADEWDELIAAGALEALRGVRVFNDPESAENTNFSAQVPRPMDYGECPNGGSLCHVGGEIIVKNHRDGHRYAPVDGGMLNCTGCRFFASGPFYLGGLIARLNALSLEVSAAGDRLRKAEKRRRDTLASAVAPGRAAQQLRESRADAACDAAQAQALTVSKAWLSTYRLIERCKTALRQHQAAEAAGDGMRRLPVVLAGTADDFRLGLERCSDYDLWQRICEDAEVFPSIDPANAALHRATRLDRVLAEAGQDAVFASLDADERVAVGNMYGKWLRTKLGHAERDALMRGERTLRDFNLIGESAALLAPHRPSMPAARPVSPSMPRPSLPASPSGATVES